MLAENPDRFCMFPIKFPDVWEMYKKAEASFWTGEPPHDCHGNPSRAVASQNLMLYICMQTHTGTAICCSCNLQERVCLPVW